MYIYALVPRRGRVKTGLWVENPFVFKCLKIRKVPTGDACLDTSQHSVGSSEVLRSASQMTTIAESRMNPEYHLDDLCDRQEPSAWIPWPVLVFTLGSESRPGEGEKGRAPSEDLVCQL